MTEHTVDIAICTFRRPQIADTLRSLAALELPQGVRIAVIVADNDDTPSARELVERTAAGLALPVRYVHAPARNISVARNACLSAATAPLFAFLDDDELATPGWLAGLLSALQPDMDVVLGPVQALYPAAAPAWLQGGDFHSTRPVWVDGEIRTGYTSNVLFRRTAAAFAGLRFDEALGRSGGEDTQFFSQAFGQGARFAFAETALLTEDVPAARASFGWLLRRRFRSGQTHALLMPRGAGSLVKPVAKAAVCLAGAVLTVWSPVRARSWLLRGALHAGAVARLLGKGDLQQYGHG